MNSSNPIVANAIATERARIRNASGVPLGTDDYVFYEGSRYRLSLLSKIASDILDTARLNRRGMTKTIQRGGYDDTNELLEVYKIWKRVGARKYEQAKADAAKIRDMNWRPDAQKMAEEVASILIRAAEIDIKSFNEDLDFMRKTLKERGVAV